MLQNYNKYKLMKIFLDSPTENFRLRELSRLSKIAPPSVMNYLKEFEHESVVKAYRKRGIPFYTAIRDSERFIFYKKLGIFYELNASGFVDFLWQILHPDAIILYGSHAKGEAIENSDLDIFIVGKEKTIDIAKFEKRLGKKVHLMFESDTKKISKELKNNLANGIMLKGYFKVIE